jgi:Mn2+/Fe2+ NRAMP family transporter
MSIEPDYSSLDPEEKTNRYLAMGSVAFGVISLCAALIPVCGASLSLAGIGLGIWGIRADSRRMAQVGIAICVFSLLTSIVYGVMVAFSQ